MSLGLDGDEFTLSNRNKMMKIIAKTAKNVVDIVTLAFHFSTFQTISLPFSTRTQFSLHNYCSVCDF